MAIFHAGTGRSMYVGRLRHVYLLRMEDSGISGKHMKTSIHFWQTMSRNISRPSRSTYVLWHDITATCYTVTYLAMMQKDVNLIVFCFVAFQVQRIERTSQLFVRRLYESAFIDLSLLLNTKMKLPKAQNQEKWDDSKSCFLAYFVLHII